MRPTTMTPCLLAASLLPLFSVCTASPVRESGPSQSWGWATSRTAAVSQTTSSIPIASSAETPTAYADSASTGTSYEPESSTASSTYMTTPPSGTSNASAYPSNPGNGTNTFQQCIGKLDGTLPEKIPAGFDFSGNVRTYYVAAEEKLWDYAPTGWDNWLGVPFNDSVRAMNAGYVQVGTQWVKALYRGYTDETFNQETEQPPTQGIQGPLLRAEVGDMVQILFYNKLTEKYASMHSMGLLYGKPNEGSDYPNTTTGGQPSFSQQEAVPPGGCVVYKWLVGEEQTPPPGEASALFAYHSFVNFMSDVNAGLVGPQIVYNRGNMSKTMASTREFPILYNIYNEASSFLAATNAELKGTNYSSDVVTLPYTYPGNESFWIPELVNMPTAQLSASEAPPFHTLNGYVFSNGPAFEMCEGDDVTWYLYAYGSASHAFHLHGNNVFYQGRWWVVINANDGDMFTLKMRAGLPGVWEVVCHVQDHLAKGMVNNYKVYPKGECPLPALS